MLNLLFCYHGQSRSSKRKSEQYQIVVIGGCGLIRKKLVNKRRERDHQVVAASPSTGVNTITGEGLTQAQKTS
jgi:hypothetical protein